jgi:predicted  nucleic acid-binding Zn-ribbon protein
MKSRKIAAASRRILGDKASLDTPYTPATSPEPIVTEEEEMVMPPPAPEESMVAGDPTQRLLTSLGRFQRQVSRAEEGASQEAWCDECMNQLIAGIEIALNEDWADVKEALTDTARVLQTYEDGSMAADCVPFLKDSYEILCLMVGDLIVGNVRSGVMKKWRERYEGALNDLAGRGLTLVDDGATRDREEPSETEGDQGAFAVDSPDPFAPAASDNGDGGAALDDGDAFDALISGSGNELVAGGGENGNVAHEAGGGAPFVPDSTEASPFDVPTDNVGNLDGTELPSLDDLLTGEEQSEEGPDLSLTSDFTAESSTPADETGGDSSPGLEEAAAVEEAPLALDLPLETENESVVEAPEQVVEEAVEPEETPTVADAEPDPGSPEALLKTAQEAMAQGNLADAKVLALQLAANMARMEAEQVESRAAEIEAEISVNAEEVSAAERAVGDAEERVKALEEQVAQCQQDFEGKRDHVQQLRDEVSTAEQQVSELDDQIAELEARRDEERGHLSERQGNLEDSLSEESRMQAELDALGEEEGGARENMDSARNRVKDLQDKGSERGAELESAQADAAARKNAVVDIEKTIGQVGGPSAGEDEVSPEEEDSDQATEDNAE